MTKEIAFTPATDVLWRNVTLNHAVDLSVFGVPVRVESNSPYPAELAVESFGPPESVGGFSEARSTRRPLPCLRIIVEPTRVADAGDNPVWRIPDPDHALFRTAGMVGMLDLTQSDGVIYVEEAYARKRAQFEQSVLRGSVLMLVTRHDRHPIHAAALRRGDAGLVLLGSSGTGKSTTCYVASRAGIDVLADDAIRIQHAPEFRVWGSPGRVHLLGDAASRFATTEVDRVRITPNGKVKHVMRVPTAEHLPPFVRRARVCILRRGAGPVRCEPATEHEIAAAILGAPEVHSDFYPAGRQPAVDALAAHGGWTLTLSEDAEETVPWLERLLAEV